MKQLMPVILILIFAGTLTGEPAEDNIKKVSEYLAQIKYDLFNNKIPPSTLIGSAGDAVSRLNNTELSKTYRDFESFYNTLPPADTLISLLNIFSHKFHSLYGDTIYSDLINANNLKAILFITSVSCECTLKQCKEYEQAFYEMINEMDVRPEFLVVDSFYEENLSAKYDVTFVPVFLILDKDNSELIRYTREEDIKIKLKNFLTERD